MDLQTFKNKVDDGLFFTVTFIKKNGERRVMNCRRRVSATKKPVNYRLGPGQRQKDDERTNNLTVYDVKKWDEKNEEWGVFRRINLDTLETVSLNGETWTWNQKNGSFVKEDG